MQTTTIKVRKIYVFAAIFFVIVAVTVFMFLRAFTALKEVTPEQITDYSNIELIQLAPPPEDAPRAEIITSMGTMTAVLYSEYTPKAVQIFTEEAAKGSYTNIEAGLYEQGSVFTIDAPDLPVSYTAEFHKDLWPFKGALCMTPDGDIVFINTVSFTEEERSYLSADEGELPEVRKAFLEHGGVPNYASKYTVLGQITDGTDILEAIASSPVGTDITIKSITVE